MRPANRITITEDQLNVLMRALGSFSKGRFANQCNASPNAAAFWFKDGKIPPIRLKYAAKELYDILSAQTGMTPDQMEAKGFLEMTFGKKLYEIAAEQLPPSFEERLGLKKQKLRQPSKAMSSEHSNDLLQSFSAEALVDALHAKGWIVNLSRKESHK